MLSNCGARVESWESFRLQGDQTSQFLKESNPEYSLEGLMLKLKIQYFGHLMQRADSLEKTLMAEKDWRQGRRRRLRMRWLDGTTDSTDKFEQTPWDSEAQNGITRSWTGLSDWTTTSSPQPKTHLCRSENDPSCGEKDVGKLRDRVCVEQG